MRQRRMGCNGQLVGIRALEGIGTGHAANQKAVLQDRLLKALLYAEGKCIFFHFDPSLFAHDPSILKAADR